MKNQFLRLTLLSSAILLGSYSNSNSQTTPAAKVKTGVGKTIELPEADTKASKTNFSKVVAWPEGKTPTAPAGFVVTKFAEGMKSPRNIVIAPNGDVIVVLSNSQRTKVEQAANEISGKAKSEVQGKSVNTIMLFRDADKDGKPEVIFTFLTGLNQPYGAAFIGNSFYVANTDGVWMYPYQAGDTEIKAAGKKILELPAGGYNNHWTRNLIVNAAQTKIYVTVGSGSNVAERGLPNEIRRANILEFNPDGTGEKIYGSGLRNPVGMAWAPGTNALWTAVNERDGLGDDLVPDYITSVKEGAFYGWPFSYFGQNEDPRLKGQNPDLVAKALVPDIPVGAHTASLGLAFYTAKKFPAKYQGGVFIGQHGSWNRSQFVGYKVAFVPFKNGKPTGQLEDFLTGFVKDEKEVYGKPVGVAVAQDGALLVADDVSGIIWRVAAK
ncbi:sorbosone dehydrogenase family protein [Pedobacter frigiditerrae]|uniref:Sorbosone dehydrogenase family protein n=1 Tax=Pedobacter frigiditerrae TaxID=2530452 RepID=A0A4R0MIR6_9SPHI|nr:sorbosone dehydrogenase family protein [Pedobacter frigiditerrae]TCC86455.1 sorbosone dehydrogenase family protein [Pedobacter frigiditerrae]